MNSKLQSAGQRLSRMVDTLRLSLSFWPFSIRTPLRLLKVNSALVMASTEQEILSAIALSVSGPACVRLFYLKLDEMDRPLEARMVASWKDGVSWQEDPALGYTFTAEAYPILMQLHAQTDPVMLVEDVQALKMKLPPASIFPNVCGMVVIKLYARRAGQRWQAFVYITWPTPHSYTSDEEYIYRGISQTASAVVSSHLLYQAALQNVERLRELDRLKTEFLYSVSHELRTPLGGIITSADNMLHGTDGEINDEIRTDLEVIRDSGNHLLGIINEILDLAKIEAGAVQLSLAPAKIGDLVDEAVHTLCPVAEAKGLKLEAVIPADLPVLVIDPPRILQVILNLVSNAIKFSEHGTITLSAYQDSSKVVVGVQDQGIGIDPKHQEVIFEPFRQVDGSPQRKQDGTGLGLPISKRLVELHGGTIWLNSEPGKGTTFYFSLPVRQP